MVTFYKGHIHCPPRHFGVLAFRDDNLSMINDCHHYPIDV
ncbi:hypothetical protein HMPREF9103_02234 [Lentilactobacillus parafarraginis F0439]|uniref:Uncharacterized protein n=1 Tax=Lentilactobacillus parafarraginis F0439 TaxID=797515 RepID=G9ZR73_9LACO|nr:hypothetical protein HMPREF9103_02234 [Lentilactobacillus parafarraginis F0439]